MQTDASITSSGRAGAAAAFAELRRRMIDEQFRDHGISDPRVLEAMGQVPREEFVPADLRSAAYDDCPLPIGFDQTMYRFTRLRGELKVENLGGFAFVPLIGKCGWRESNSN